MDKNVKSRIVIANVIELAKNTISKGVGAGYTLPTGYDLNLEITKRMETKLKQLTDQALSEVRTNGQANLRFGVQGV